MPKVANTSMSAALFAPPFTKSVRVVMPVMVPPPWRRSSPLSGEKVTAMESVPECTGERFARFTPAFAAAPFFLV